MNRESYYFKCTFLISLILFSFLDCHSQSFRVNTDTIPYKIYPLVNNSKPNLPSPFTSTDGNEFIIAGTKEGQYALIPVSLSNDRDICKQLIIDTTDFPDLATTGLHKEETLHHLKTITGRSIDEITEIARPGNLSSSGFLAEDENIRSVLLADNQLVRNMGLTHPQLAKPLFHVLNMMDMDLKLNRWNMARHQWENIKAFYYNDLLISVIAYDTKGGQKSIFNDNIEGSFHIKIWRELTPEEKAFLKEKYDHLSHKQFDEFKQKLSFINTGEMEPQYIMRYGFYEGHTYWRSDPISIAFIFGLKTLNELEDTFNEKLYQMLTEHFTE